MKNKKGMWFESTLKVKKYSKTMLLRNANYSIDAWWLSIKGSEAYVQNHAVTEYHHYSEESKKKKITNIVKWCRIFT